MTRQKRKLVERRFRIVQGIALGAVVGQLVLQYALTNDANERSTVALISALAVLPIIGSTGSKDWKTIVVPLTRIAVLVLAFVLMVSDLIRILDNGVWEWTLLSWLVPVIAVGVSWVDSLLSDSQPPMACPHCARLLVVRDGDAVTL